MEKKSDRILTSLKEIQLIYAQLGENKNYDELLSKIFQLSNDLLQEKKILQSNSNPKSETRKSESREHEYVDPATEEPEVHKTEIHDINNQIKETFKIIERRTTKKIPSAYIPSGFELLDRRIGGWEPGELIVIGSRPSVGKTSLGLSLMRNVAVIHDIPCAYFTFETGVQHLTERIIAAEAEIDITKLKNGKLTDREWGKLESNLRKILDKKIYLISDPLLNPDNLHLTIERLVTEKGVKLVVLDYLQLIIPYRIRRNREQEVSTIIRKIKATAKELNIVVLLLSQLNRSVELRSGYKRPMLSDLRESGAIEDDADKVIFIHRPEFYGIMEDEQGNSLKGIAELIIAKNRTGVTDELPLRFDSNYGKFTQLDIVLEALGDIHPGDILDEPAPF
jgi:replicative DNA helicase